MVNSYLRSIFRSVKSSFSRFLAIFAIVALGTGFLSGLMVTTPDMRHSVQVYYNEQTLMDLRVVSNLGLVQEDIDAVAAAHGVDAVMPWRSTDMQMVTESGDTLVTRLHGVPDGFFDGEGINGTVLVSGRYPAAPGECVIEDEADFLPALQPGSKLVLSDDNKDAEDTLAVTEYTITGIVRSPYYLSMVQRGQTSVGNGQLGIIAYVPETAFSTDYYTDLFVTLRDAQGLDIFSDAYEAASDAGIEVLEALAETQKHLRHDDLLTEANEKLADAKQELADGEAEARQELADAYAELTDGQQEYDDGLRELQDAYTELTDGQREYDEGLAEFLAEEPQALADITQAEHDIADGWRQLSDGEQELAQAKLDFAAAEAEVEDARRQLQEGRQELEDGKQELKDARAELEKGEADYKKGSDAIDSGWRGVADGRAQVNQLKSQRTQLQGGIAQTEGGLAQLNTFLDANRAAVEAMRQNPNPSQAELDAIALFDGYAAQAAGLTQQLTIMRGQLQMLNDGITQAEAELTDAQRQLIYNEGKLREAREKLADGWAELKTGEAELAQAEIDLTKAEQEFADGEAELERGRQELADAEAEVAENRQKLLDAQIDLSEGKAELEQARADLAEAQRELADGWAEYYDGKRELADAKQELADGWQEYYEAEAEVAEELLEAQDKITEAEDKIADIEHPEWYILGRDTIPSYVTYESDTEKVASIAKIFPVFFFLIAALVSSTTMTRMIEEERGVIGTLKALGYSNGAIAAKYIAYASFATLLGSGAGLLVGLRLFPAVLSNAYTLMYALPPMNPDSHLAAGVLSTLVIFLAILFSTLTALRHSLIECAASLMRPKAPPAGKRIFLERISFLWKRMKFTHKVTARNLIRYKKRFFMTTVGIAGCTALLLCGFGLRDSISDIVDLQFGQIFTYDMILGIKHAGDAESDVRIRRLLEDESIVTDYTVTHQESGTARYNGNSTELTVIVPQDPAQLPDFVTFRSRTTGDAVHYDADSVILTEKASRTLGIDVGDTIRLENVDGEGGEVTVTGIAENYVQGYIYLPERRYEAIFGQECEYLTLLAKTTCADEAARDDLAETLLRSPNATLVQFNSTVRETFHKMLRSIEYIVIVLILAAAALAFVVLYNLTNINIAERHKEIATLKVLGFTQPEVSGYIFRETLILSIVGAAAGLIAGIFLHSFVVQTAEVDAVMFGRTIKTLSYVLSFAVTMLFSGIVSMAMTGKLRRISMADSLKAPE